ncbi:Defensin fusion [Medicago truncatula]|nr:Defensin fusion [Medicago truncatula]
MSKSFAIFVLVASVKLIEVEASGAECTKIIGRCDKANCATHCQSYAKGVAVLGSSCSFYNLCTCAFDRSPPGLDQPACEVGLGLCNAQCSDSCCNTNCVRKYQNLGGVGKCIFAFDKVFCLCTYRG